MRVSCTEFVLHLHQNILIMFLVPFVSFQILRNCFKQKFSHTAFSVVHELNSKISKHLVALNFIVEMFCPQSQSRNSVFLLYVGVRREGGKWAFPPPGNWN